MSEVVAPEFVGETNFDLIKYAVETRAKLQEANLKLRLLREFDQGLRRESAK